jgi:thioredoxin
MNEITQNNYEDTLTNNKMVVLKYGADWCPPCKMLEPILEGISKENEDWFFGSVDIDQQSGLAKNAEVTSVPTTFIFVDGKQVHRQTGVINKQDLQGLLDTYTVE